MSVSFYILVTDFSFLTWWGVWTQTKLLSSPLSKECPCLWLLFCFSPQEKTTGIAQISGLHTVQMWAKSVILWIQIPITVRWWQGSKLFHSPICFVFLISLSLPPWGVVTWIVSMEFTTHFLQPWGFAILLYSEFPWISTFHCSPANCDFNIITSPNVNEDLKADLALSNWYLVLTKSWPTSILWFQELKLKLEL